MHQPLSDDTRPNQGSKIVPIIPSRLATSSRGANDQEVLLTQAEAADYVGIPLHALVRLNVARALGNDEVRYRKSVLDNVSTLATVNAYKRAPVPEGI